MSIWPAMEVLDREPRPDAMNEVEYALAEEQRVNVLRSFGVLDTPAERDFDDLTALASEIAGTPMALVSLVENERQWFKSRLGIELCETDRGASFCAHTLWNDEPLCVRDAMLDPRFATNRLVVGEPGIRFYAGFPLINDDGFHLGALCVLDREPRDLTSRQMEQLQAIARQVMAQLRLRRQASELASEVALRRSSERALADAAELHRSMFEFAPLAQCLLELDGTVRYVNAAMAEFVDLDRHALVGRHRSEFSHPDDTEVGADEHAQLINGERQMYSMEKRYVRADGSVVWGLVFVTAVRNGDGAATSLVVQIKDITKEHLRELELTRISEELSEANALLRAAAEGAAATGALYKELVERLPDTVAFVYGRDRRIQVASGAGLSVRGYDVDNLVGRFAEDILEPSDAELLHGFLDAAFAGHATSIELKLATTGLENQVDVVPLTYGDGEAPDAVLVVARDIGPYKEREAAAEAAEAQWRAVFDGGPVGMVEVGLDDEIVCANKAMSELLGLPAEEIVGTLLHDHLAPANPEELVARSNAIAHGKSDRETVEYRLLTANGDKRWATLRATVLTTTRGGPTRVLVHVTETTDEHESWEKLESTHARFSALVEHSSDAIIITEASGIVTFASPGTTSLTGNLAESMIGVQLWDLCHPDDRMTVSLRLADALADDGETAIFECRIEQTDGTWRYVEFTATNRLWDTAVGGMVLNGRDITERVDAANRLEYQATHDTLTGLDNRALLLSKLEHAIATERASAVFYVDLDHFKAVNDKLGHAAGDELLMSVAARLRRVVRPDDCVARLGGDEFVILAGGIYDYTAAIAVAERTCASLHEDFSLSGEIVTIGCSVGIAISEGHTSTTLLQEADTALYLAKHAGRNRWATCPGPDGVLPETRQASNEPRPRDPRDDRR